MSTMKFVIIAGVCLLLAGCAPITGVKSVAALILSIVAMAGAGLGLLQQNHEHTVYQKARELDRTITIHEQKYHRPEQTTNVVSLESRQGQATTGDNVAASVSHMNRRT